MLDPRRKKRRHETPRQPAALRDAALRDAASGDAASGDAAPGDAALEVVAGETRSSTLGRVRPRGQVLLILLALGCGACSRCESDDVPGGEDATMDSPFDPERPADPLAPPDERYPLGVWADADDYRMRVVALEECEVEPYFAPRPGHRKIGVLLEVAGRRDEPIPVNGLFATLLDAGGESYRPTPAGCRPSLPAGRVDAGQSVRGFVSFEIPQDAGGLVLRYEPVIVGRAPRALSFDLGQ